MSAVDHLRIAVTSGASGSLESVQRGTGQVALARTDVGGPA